MRNTNPAESMEAEGLPELEDHPPGMDIELDQESMTVPRDHPIAAGDDPAYATTAAEERAPAGVAARAARENPDVGASELGVGGGVQGSHAVAADDAGQIVRLGDGISGDDGLAEPPEDAADLAAEEAAVHVRPDVDDL
jgi:hypothetical protein